MAITSTRTRGYPDALLHLRSAAFLTTNRTLDKPFPLHCAPTPAASFEVDEAQLW
jgi:hypothetical protein